MLVKSARAFIGVLFLGLALNLGCATTSGPYTYNDAPIPPDDYSQVVNKWSVEEKVYSGLSSSFQINATMHSMDLLYHQVFQDSISARNTREQYLASRSKVETEAQQQLSFFVALYTEKDENNDLDKSKTLWNIFLDVKGRRVTPKSIKRVFEKRAVLQNRYPFLTPWSRLYLVTFPVRVTDAMDQPVVLTMASPLGAAHLKFPKD